MLWFNKLSRKERIGLIVAVTFVFFAVVERLAVSPISGKIKRIENGIKICEKELGCDLRSLNQKDTVLKEYNKYIKYVEKHGSNEEEVAGILAEIEELARKSNIYLVNTKPQSPREVGFYKEYSIEIEAEGEIESLINFLHQLNNSEQLLRADKMNISLKNKESSLVKIGVLITKVVL